MTLRSDSAPLSFKEKLGYGLGDMASNFYLGFFGLFLLYYYTDIYGIAPAAVGLMMLISKIVDAVSDPGMGLIADRTESKRGKYRPYLLWGAVPYGLLGFAIFFGPDFGPTGKLIYAYVTYIGVMLAFTLMNVPYSALLAVISPVSEERTKATTYRFICAGLGGMLVAAFATPLKNILGGGDDVLGFRLTMAIFAVLSVALFWITYATTKERIKLTPHKSSVKKDLGVLFKNASWVFLAISCILIVVGLISRFGSIIFYVKYYMQDNGETVFFIFDRVALIMSVGLFGQVVGAIFATKIAKFFNKHSAVLVMSLVHSLFLVLSFFTSPNDYWLSFTYHFLGMITFGVSITLLFAMFTDCAEYGEWLHGSRSSGLTVSASMFALKFGSAMGGALPGFILGGVGFVANEIQTETSIMGIRVMSTLMPAALFAVGGAVLFFYKINRELLAKIEQELIVRRANTITE